MNFFGTIALLAAAGTETQPGSGSNPGDMMRMIGPLVIMAVMFYFLMIRPQSKKAREHAELLKALKSGDKVITSGGIMGIVISVKDKSVSIRSADTKLEILKSAVSEITEKASSPAES